ncbi:MAG: type II secretion system F family protein [Nanoarchaeota archaeon]|nr:type II secretion system F family protein [Nanoarchaeota archaeon]
MMDELKKNVTTEIEILREISSYVRRQDYASGEDKKLLDGAISSLTNSMKLINNAIPQLVKEISISQRLPVSSQQDIKTIPSLETISFKRVESNVEVILNSQDRDKFLKELSISETFVKRLKKQEARDIEKYEEFKASRGYLKLSNRLFFEKAKDLIKRGHFKSLSVELQRANLDILFESYVAMIFFSILLSIIVSFVLVIILIFVNVNLSWPIVSLYDGSYLLRLAEIFWIPIAAPILTFLVLYYYPSTEKSSIGKKIDQELPFAVIHMSAISGSGIEPSEIFRIIGLSKEYPTLRREVRKVLNQINLYGYDLVTSLNNAARSAPSQRLAELFSGLSVTITSGASLPDFFSKRAESLLISYRLEREKYTNVAETFMDIYISLVIAAPMILLLLLIIISISGVESGFSTSQLGIVVVGIVSLLNILFLGFLYIRQPSY